MVPIVASASRAIKQALLIRHAKTSTNALGPVFAALNRFVRTLTADFHANVQRASRSVVSTAVISTSAPPFDRAM